MDLNALKGKGPMCIGADGKVSDTGLYDMEADKKYTELTNLRLIRKAMNAELEDRKGMTNKELVEESLKKFAGNILKG